MFEDKDDTILARWLANDLTLEEIKEFETSAEYAQYVRITKGLDRLEKPSFDTTALRGRIQKEIEKPKKTNRIPVKYISRITATAASILLLIGIFFNNITYTTGVGDSLTVDLPDGSIVQMNSGTTLKRKRFFWSSNRNLSLEGEAFFDVTSGGDFIVTTPQGDVAVLGTQFNIRTRNTSFSLACFEGKVQYTKVNSQEATQITVGQKINVVEGVIEHSDARTQPSWMERQSQFKSAPLHEVLEELKLHYNLDIDIGVVDTTQLFTGSFRYDDIELALRTVCLTMGLDYKLSNDKRSVKLLKR